MQEISRANVLALIGAAAAAAVPRAARTATLTTIRMGASTADTMSEPFYGLADGAFERAGLKVGITTLLSGSVMLAACAGDAIDVGVADAIQVANAVTAGIPLAIFASAAMYSIDAPTTELFVAKDSPIVTAKDFEGKAIALNSLHSLSEIAVREWLHQNGADASLVKFLELGGSAQLESAARGTVAGALAGEPHLAVAKDRLRLFAKPYDIVAKTFPLSLFFARRSWLTGNPDVARRLTNAIYETARWANAHPDDTAPIVEKNAQLEAAVLRRRTRAKYGTAIDAQSMQPILDIAVKYKIIKQPIAASEIIANI